MTLDLFLVFAFVALMTTSLVYFARDFLDPLTLFTVLNSTRFILRPAALLFGLDEVENLHLFRERPADVARETMLIFMLGYVAYVLGYTLGRGRLATALARKIPGFSASEVRVKRLGWLVVALVALASLSTAYFLSSLGYDLGTYMREARLGLFAGYSFLTALPELAAFLAALLFHFALARGRGVTLATLLFLGASLNLLLMGERGGIVSAMLFVAVLHHFCVKPMGVRGFLAAGAILAVALTGLGVIRKGISSTHTDVQVESAADMVSTLRSDEHWSPVLMLRYMNADATDHFMVVVQDFDTHNFRYGKDFYHGLIGVVPRSVWPNKPERITVGQWFTGRYFPGKPSGRPITAVGAYYLNFGLPGVFALMLLSGYMGRVMWSYVTGSGFRPWAVFVYLLFMFKVTSWGLLLTTMPMVMVTVALPTLGILAFTTRESRRTPPASRLSPARGAA